MVADYGVSATQAAKGGTTPSVYAWRAWNTPYQAYSLAEPGAGRVSMQDGNDPANANIAKALAKPATCMKTKDSANPLVIGSDVAVPAKTYSSVYNLAGKKNVQFYGFGNRAEDSCDYEGAAIVPAKKAVSPAPVKTPVTPRASAPAKAATKANLGPMIQTDFVKAK